MLSFTRSKNAKPICKIVGGKDAGNTVYLHNKEDVPDAIDTRCIASFEYFKYLALNDGKFTIIPNFKNDRDIIAFFGPSGAGKSWLMKVYLTEYIKEYPNRPIYMFSKKKNDISFQEIAKLRRVIIDDKLVSEPIPYEVFKDSMIVFDDIDTLSDATRELKQIKLSVTNIKNDILELGRDMHQSALISSHLATKGHETKTLLNEAQQIVIYPSSGCNYDYLLSKYLGLTTKQINRVKEFDTRWVIFQRSYPRTLFTEQEVMFLKDL